jgi:hypothetical protein
LEHEVRAVGEVLHPDADSFLGHADVLLSEKRPAAVALLSSRPAARPKVKRILPDQLTGLVAQ